MEKGSVRVSDALTGRSELIEFEYDPAKMTQAQRAGQVSGETIHRWHLEWHEAHAAQLAAAAQTKAAKRKTARKENADE